MVMATCEPAVFAPLNSNINRIWLIIYSALLVLTLNSAFVDGQSSQLLATPAYSIREP